MGTFFYDTLWCDLELEFDREPKRLHVARLQLGGGRPRLPTSMFVDSYVGYLGSGHFSDGISGF